MGPNERSKLVHRMLAVEQGPNDAEASLVTEELEHPHGGLKLTIGGNHIYLRTHADSIARSAGLSPVGSGEVGRGGGTGVEGVGPGWGRGEPLGASLRGRSA
jgi:hypothetical protein